MTVVVHQRANMTIQNEPPSSGKIIFRVDYLHAGSAEEILGAMKQIRGVLKIKAEGKLLIIQTDANSRPQPSERLDLVRGDLVTAIKNVCEKLDRMQRQTSSTTPPRAERASYPSVPPSDRRW